jgi:hypothetical protein
MTTNYFGGLEPFQPFALRVPVQTADPFSDELVSITVGKSWIAYIIGCVQALNAAASWATQDAATIQQMRTWVANLTAQLMTWSVPVDLVFRRNPTNPVAADYSVDGGATWVAMPDTWAYFYPEFTSDLATPSGYSLSVNYGNNVEVVPQMNQVVNDAIRTDPSSSIVNTVSTATGITPLELISGGATSLLIQSQEKAIAMARKAGFDTSTSEAFLEITKTVADVGDVLVTVISP